MSTNNILSPANGEPIIMATQDVVLGLYYMTREKINVPGEGSLFSDVAEVMRAYEMEQVSLQAKIKVRIREVSRDAEQKEISITKLVDTTVGRAILWSIVPQGLPFSLIDRPLTKKVVSGLLSNCHRILGTKTTVIFADQLMYMGFRYATKAAISIGLEDIVVPEKKQEIIAKAEKEVLSIERQYTSGFVTHGERYNKVIDIWSRTSDQVAKAMMDNLSVEMVVDREGKTVTQSSFNPVFMMADSGARGSAAQIRQLAGMRGLMSKPDGSIMETPITANFREGLSVLQYFISTHGARKGLADTAIKTANSGYLTRRLVDVAQDLVVRELDCGTSNYIVMKPLIEGGDVIESLHERVLGRVCAEDILDPITHDVLIPSNTLLDEHEVKIIEERGIDQIKLRSPITCDTIYGICAMCYGRDLSRGRLVNIGEAIGIMAAQSIGEPGTQLTMRTFHIGGAASRTMAANSVRVKSNGKVRLLNMKTVKQSSGKLIVVSRSGELSVIDNSGREKECYKIPYGAALSVENDKVCEAGQVVAEWDPHTHPIITEAKGRARFIDLVDGVNMKRQTDELTGLSTIVILVVRNVAVLVMSLDL
jgi:DNA-directed RNA polymerase subunit beta'